MGCNQQECRRNQWAIFGSGSKFETSGARFIFFVWTKHTSVVLKFDPYPTRIDVDWSCGSHNNAGKQFELLLRSTAWRNKNRKYSGVQRLFFFRMFRGESHLPTTSQQTTLFFPGWMLIIYGGFTFGGQRPQRPRSPCAIVNKRLQWESSKSICVFNSTAIISTDLLKLSELLQKSGKSHPMVATLSLWFYSTPKALSGSVEKPSYNGGLGWQWWP